MTAHANDVTATYPKPLRLKLQQGRAGYEFSLEQRTPVASDDQLDVTGTIDSDSSMIRLVCRMTGPLDSNEISVILAWTGLSPGFGGRLQFDARVDMEGSWRNIKTIQTKGHVTLTDGAVFYQGVELASKLSVHVRGQRSGL